MGEKFFQLVSLEVGFKVVGVQWCLRGGTVDEFQSRMRLAWSKFWSVWPLLRRRMTSFSKRLRLLDSVDWHCTLVLEKLDLERV